VTAVPRVGGRIILVDHDERVLLINERIERGTHWLTPGGGVEDGEHPRDAAAREVFEETGIEVADSGDAVLTTRRTWTWAGVSYDQTDHFFLARVPSGTPVTPHHLTEIEIQTLIGHRWWTLDELGTTDEFIEPAGFVAALPGLIAGLPPVGGG
jgi:8-oxo-dGTP pyrophosphatase MutT (NUDIX family)